jgi:sensor histidine kinase regulating citrate/malate metabolism
MSPRSSHLGRRRRTRHPGRVACGDETAFVRGPASGAGGSGLGLALVDQQVSLHGGTFGLGESASGGLRATIVLPSS